MSPPPAQPAVLESTLFVTAVAFGLRLYVQARFATGMAYSGDFVNVRHSEHIDQRTADRPISVFRSFRGRRLRSTFSLSASRNVSGHVSYRARLDFSAWSLDFQRNGIIVYEAFLSGGNRRVSLMIVHAAEEILRNGAYRQELVSFC